LLAEFYTTTFIPPAVVEELDRGRAIGIDLPDVRELSRIEIRVPERPDKAPTSGNLGAGEKEVLALGIQLQAAVVILDERLARVHAEALSLNYTGTLGLLLRAKAEGLVPRISLLVEHLDRLGFRLSPQTRAAVLRQAGE
jgi:uncharacterized protein